MSILQNALQHSSPSLITQQQIEDWLFNYSIENIPLGFDGEKYLYKCKLSPDIAKKMIKHHSNPANRKINAGFVKKYAVDMETGNWQDNGESIKYYYDYSLADGNHRLHAIIKADVEIWIPIYFGLSKTINQFDTNRTRSVQDQLNMSGDPDLAKQSTIINALAYLENNNANFSGNQSNSERINIGNKFKNSIYQYKHLFKDELNAHIPAWAALIWAEQKYPNEISGFINQIVLGSGLASDSPILHLRNWLFKVKNKSSAGERRKVAMVTLYCFREFLLKNTMNKITPKMYEKKNSYDLLK